MELLDTFDKPGRPVTVFLSLARGLLDVTTDFIGQSSLGCIGFSCLLTPAGYTGTEVMPVEKRLGIRHRFLSLVTPHTWLYWMVDNHLSFRVCVRLRRTRIGRRNLLEHRPA